MVKIYRPAVFCVAYSIEKNRVEYFLLKRKLHWTGWEFPKGKIEPGENKSKTAIREVQEETGLKVLRDTLKDYKIAGRYSYKKILTDRPNYKGQTYSLFSVQVKKGRVSLDKKEHSGHKWESFEKTLKSLTWPNQRKCLRIVNKYLSTKNK